MSNRLIAIGDIHGCFRALRGLLRAVAPDGSDTLVFLGDFVDRGPQSREVIELITRLQQRTKVVAIRGNHEEMMLSVLNDQLDHSIWLNHGGLSTLDSYGFNGDRNFLPSTHQEFLDSLVDYHELDSFFFTHACYDPSLPLAAQPSDVLRWQSLHAGIPEPHHSGKTAIVGHTAHPGGDCLDVGHLICIDTGCYAGGYLTALDVHRRAIWQVDPDGNLR